IGSAQDDTGGSGLKATFNIEIATGPVGTRSDWTGSSWTAAGSPVTWITTNTANPWYYSISSNALVSGNAYYLRTQATDRAGNTFTSQTSTFTFNTTAPTVVISTQPPGNGFYSALPVFVSTPFAGTATPVSVTGVLVTTV